MNRKAITTTMTAAEYRAIGKRPKYGASPTVIDGIRFDSKREAERYRELRLMEKVGAITNLVLQPRYPIVVEGQKICVYVADFTYRELPACKQITEDVKGVKTPIYKLKKKLVRAIYGVEIRETN